MRMMIIIMMRMLMIIIYPPQNLFGSHIHSICFFPPATSMQQSSSAGLSQQREARPPVSAHRWERAGPVPSAAVTASSCRGGAGIVERWGAERTPTETDDGRSGFVRSGPGRVHHRPHHIRQTATDHPESAVVGEEDILRARARLCVCVCVVVGVLCVL